MVTDRDYREMGLNSGGIERAKRIEAWLELIVEELYEQGGTPWDVRDFLVRCVNAVALSREQIANFVCKKTKE